MNGEMNFGTLATGSMMGASRRPVTRPPRGYGDRAGLIVDQHPVGPQMAQHFYDGQCQERDHGFQSCFSIHWSRLQRVLAQLSSMRSPAGIV